MAESEDQSEEIAHRRVGRTFGGRSADKLDTSTATVYRRMSRRTLRSAGVGFRSSGRALAIPNNMPVNGTIEVVSAKRIKREHEDDVYVRVRSLRTGQQTDSR